MALWRRIAGLLTSRARGRETLREATRLEQGLDFQGFLKEEARGKAEAKAVEASQSREPLTAA